MAKPSSISRGTLDVIPQRGSLSSASSPLTLFNSNSLQAQSDPDDILGILEGTVTNAGNCILVPVPPGALYLQLYHMTLRDATSTTISTDPVIRAFGRLPQDNDAWEGNPLAFSGAPTPLPPRLNSAGQSLFRIPSLKDPTTEELKADARGFYIPLTKPGYTKGSPSLTLDETGWASPYTPHASNPIASNGGTALFSLSEPEYVWLAGASHVLVPVVTAAVFSAGTNVSRIVGHFAS